MIDLKDGVVGVCQQILKASLKGLTCESEEEHRQRGVLFELSTKEFAREYPAAFQHVFVQSLRAPQDATRIAEQGLQALNNLLEFKRSGKTSILDVAISERFDSERRFDTFEIQGRSEYRHAEDLIYENLKLVNDLSRTNHVENSSLAAFEQLFVNPEWCDLRGRRFVVLGALDELSPTIELLQRGATVLAIDLPSVRAWDELKQRTSKETCGVLVLPYLNGTVGANLCGSLPEIAHWIVENTISNPATIFVNLGEHRVRSHEELVQMAAGCDALLEFVCNLVPETVIAHFCSPTEPSCVSVSSMEASVRKLDSRAPVASFAEDTLSQVTYERVFKRARFEIVTERKLGGGRVPLGNSIKSQGHLGRHDADSRTFLLLNQMNDEGCGFHLAKLIQKWRVLVARAIGTHRWLADKRKHRVSATVLPLIFEPYGRDGEWLKEKAFRQGRESLGLVHLSVVSCRTLGMLLMIRDLRDPTSPSNPTLQLDNPFQVFQDAAIHGGVWTCAFQLNTVDTIYAASFIAKRLGVLLTASAAVAMSVG